MVSASSGKSYLWRDGTVIDLDTLTGADYFEPRAINDRGQVVGYAWLSAGGLPHTFLWQQGKFTDLGVFEPADVNDRGDVVGSMVAPGAPSHAVLWSRGVLTRLNVPGVSSRVSRITTEARSSGSTRMKPGIAGRSCGGAGQSSSSDLPQPSDSTTAARSPAMSKLQTAPPTRSSGSGAR